MLSAAGVTHVWLCCPLSPSHPPWVLLPLRAPWVGPSLRGNHQGDPEGEESVLPDVGRGCVWIWGFALPGTQGTQLCPSPDFRWGLMTWLWVCWLDTADDQRLLISGRWQGTSLIPAFPRGCFSLAWGTSHPLVAECSFLSWRSSPCDCTSFFLPHPGAVWSF